MVQNSDPNGQRKLAMPNSETKGQSIIMMLNSDTNGQRKLAMPNSETKLVIPNSDTNG